MIDSHVRRYPVATPDPIETAFSEIKQHLLPHNRQDFKIDTPIPAVVIEKGGDFPPFWMQDNSFLEVMEELYERVRKKNA